MTRQRSGVLLLDAMNVIHAAPDIRGVADLLARLNRGRWAGMDITLVCDGETGRRDPHEQAAVTRLLSGTRRRRVLYAGPFREADDLIEDLLREAAHSESVLVVSSDRRLRSAAVRVGARCIGAREFVVSLREDGRAGPEQGFRPESVDPSLVPIWLRRFGLAPDRPIPEEAVPEDLDMDRWLGPP